MSVTIVNKSSEKEKIILCFKESKQKKKNFMKKIKRKYKIVKRLRTKSL